MQSARRGLGCCILVALALAAGCPQRTDPAEQPKTGGAAAGMTRERAEARARAFLTHLQKSEWEQASQMTVPAFAKALPATGLAALWQQLEAQQGAFARITATEVKPIGDAHTFVFTCAFARQPLLLIVSIDGQGRVQGLFKRPAPGAKAAPRPQHPKPPFPYAQREVVFDNPRDKSKHAGTLTLPRGKGPHPAAVLISGSGSQDRDETIFEHKPFWVLADALTRAGIAVLRVDDRGIGGSGGDVATATTHTYATDVSAAIDFLARQPEIAPKKIGLIGHSEGGLIAPIVAATHPGKVAFIVALAGPGVPGHQVITWQAVAALRGRPGVSEQQLTRLHAIQARIMKASLGDRSNSTRVPEARYSSNREPKARASEASGKFAAALRQALQDSDALGLGPKMTAAQLEARVTVESARLLSPWVQTFLALDPAPYWAKVRCPVLAINGEKDTQVGADQNLPAIAKALAKAGNKDVTTKQLASLNHLFQTAQTGQLEEYAQLQETFAPAALTLVTQWIARRVLR